MATFKSVWMKKVINSVAEKVFAVSHVKSTYYDYSEGKLLSDKLDEIDSKHAVYYDLKSLVNVTSANMQHLTIIG